MKNPIPDDNGPYRTMALAVPRSITTNLAEELRSLSAPPPRPRLDLEQLNRDLAYVVQECFGEAREHRTEVGVFFAVPGWCGWPGVDNDGKPRPGGHWAFTASAEVKARAAVQLGAVIETLRARGLRVSKFSDTSICVSWKRTWWSRCWDRIYNGLLFGSRP